VEGSSRIAVGGRVVEGDLHVRCFGEEILRGPNFRYTPNRGTIGNEEGEVRGDFSAGADSSCRAEVLLHSENRHGPGGILAGNAATGEASGTSGREGSGEGRERKNFADFSWRESVLKRFAPGEEKKQLVAGRENLRVRRRESVGREEEKLE